MPPMREDRILPSMMAVCAVSTDEKMISLVNGADDARVQEDCL